MPFTSESQRKYFYSQREAGKFSPEMVKHWEDATPKGKKLPNHVGDKKMKKHAFIDGFDKIAGIGKMLKNISSQHYDKAGLGLLAVPTAYRTAKAVKEKKPGEAALGATELAGLGALYHAVRKAHA